MMPVFQDVLEIQFEQIRYHEFILPMVAVPWQAPRVGKRGGKSPGKYDTYKQEVFIRAKTVYHGPCYDGVPIAVEYMFVLPRTTNMLVPCGPNDPDTGNCEKGFSDSLQGVTWKSDKWLVIVNSSKRYVEPGEKPHIKVAFEPVIFNLGNQLDKGEDGNGVRAINV
jgi:hypothetical protein